MTYTVAAPDQDNETGTAAIEAAKNNLFQGTEDAVQDLYPIRDPTKSHLSRNRKVHKVEPPLDYYSMDDNFNDFGEESESLN